MTAIWPRSNIKLIYFSTEYEQEQSIILRYTQPNGVVRSGILLWVKSKVIDFYRMVKN